MARGRGGFLMGKSQSDEAKELAEQAKKKGRYGSIGSMLGTLALTPLLGPGAGIAMKTLIPTLGSALGSYLGYESYGDIDKGLWFGEQREEIESGFKTDLITGATTTGLTAGLTPWLTGGMKTPFFTGKGLDVAGRRAAKEAAKQAIFVEKFGESLPKDAVMLDPATNQYKILNAGKVKTEMEKYKGATENLRRGGGLKPIKKWTSPPTTTSGVTAPIPGGRAPLNLADIEGALMEGWQAPLPTEGAGQLVETVSGIDQLSPATGGGVGDIAQDTGDLANPPEYTKTKVSSKKTQAERPIDIAGTDVDRIMKKWEESDFFSEMYG